MINDKADSPGFLDPLGQIGDDAVEAARRISADAAASITAIAEEAGRLSLNGYHSVEDAAVSGLTSVKDAAGFVIGQSKEIATNPGKSYGNVKAKAADALGTAKNAAEGLKNAATDSYQRRDELLDKAKARLLDAKAKLRNAADDPGAVWTDARKHGSELGGGFVRGAVGSLRDMTGHLQVGRDDIRRLLETIERQSDEYKSLRAAGSNVSLNAATGLTILDAILVGGDVLDQALARQIPQAILEAYKSQYPGLALDEPFRTHISELTEDQRPYFVNAIRGKLFEHRYLEDLNDGRLPEGYSAVLAGQANQPGYDIEIHGPDGHISELIQMKATDSVNYVMRALERYPDISVVTTSEVHSELVMRGMAENVVDGQILNSSLKDFMQEKGVEAAEADFHGPSIICLALLAFTSYSRDDLSAYERSRHFADRAGAYGVAFGFGAVADYALDVMLEGAAGVPFISLIAATTSRFLTGTGRRKFERRDALRELVESNETILNRWRQSPAGNR